MSKFSIIFPFLPIAPRTIGEIPSTKSFEPSREAFSITAKECEWKFNNFFNKKEVDIT